MAGVLLSDSGQGALAACDAVSVVVAGKLWLRLGYCSLGQ